jgi:hypothetical protein
MTFCHDCGLDEWKFGDEEMSFCPSSLHVESLESWATDIPFLFLDLANHLPNDDGLSYTVEQDYNDGTEEDTSSWLDLAEFLDFEANTSQNSPPWTAPAGQRSRTSTEDPCNYVTGSTHDSSTLASSTPTSSSNTKADTRDHSTTLESQPVNSNAPPLPEPAPAKPCLAVPRRRIVGIEPALAANFCCQPATASSGDRTLACLDKGGGWAGLGLDKLGVSQPEN